MARAYPEHPLPSCHALVRQGDRVLLVRRARAPLAGYFSLPGGSVELGETVEQALLREVREETGLQVSITRFLGYANAIDHDADHRVKWHYIILYFAAEVTGGVEAPADDAAEVRWMTIQEARQHLLTDSVERCFRWTGLEHLEGGDN